MHVAEREQAELVEAVGVAVGVEAAVVAVTAPVADLGEVAEGGGAGSVAEGVLQLGKGDRGLGSQHRSEQVGGAAGHHGIVYADWRHGSYTIALLGRRQGLSRRQTA